MRESGARFASQAIAMLSSSRGLGTLGGGEFIRCGGEVGSQYVAGDNALTGRRNGEVARADEFGLENGVTAGTVRPSDQSMTMSQLARCAEKGWAVSLTKARACQRVVAVKVGPPLASWIGRVSLIWPHCDGLIWLHLRHAGAVL